MDDGRHRFVVGIRWNALNHLAREREPNARHIRRQLPQESIVVPLPVAQPSPCLVETHAGDHHEIYRLRRDCGAGRRCGLQHTVRTWRQIMRAIMKVN